MAHSRRLNVPGEDLPKVHHSFTEPYEYVRKNVMVVGGGNSAAEAALFLSDEGAQTIFAIWRADWENRDPKMNAIKHWVRAPLEEHIKNGSLRLLLLKHLDLITEHEVRLVHDDGQTLILTNDAVFILIGSDADLTLLRQAGVETAPSGFTEVPIYDPETFETNVSGLFVVGHFTHARHIKEAIAVPRRIMPMIAHGLRTTV
jgi:thioredoxin reductase (NADPH)